MKPSEIKTVVIDGREYPVAVYPAKRVRRTVSRHTPSFEVAAEERAEAHYQGIDPFATAEPCWKGGR